MKDSNQKEEYSVYSKAQALSSERVSKAKNIANKTQRNHQVVQGVGKNEPTIVNQEGGRQSDSPYDFTLADPKAMFEMCKVLKEGAEKYGVDNWRLLPLEDHLNHLLVHVYAYLAGDRSDDHLSHLLCRALFAQAVAIQTEEDVKKAKERLQERPRVRITNGVPGHVTSNR